MKVPFLNRFNCYCEKNLCYKCHSVTTTTYNNKKPHVTPPRWRKLRASIFYWGSGPWFISLSHVFGECKDPASSFLLVIVACWSKLQEAYYRTKNAFIETISSSWYWARMTFQQGSCLCCNRWLIHSVTIRYAECRMDSSLDRISSRSFPQ